MEEDTQVKADEPHPVRNPEPEVKNAGITNDAFEGSSEDLKKTPEDSEGKIWGFRPFVMAFFGGGLCPAVDVQQLSGGLAHNANWKKLPLIDAEFVDTRATWDNSIEFLMSCIATAVGLGNIWRFPFVAYQNGGGAFLIPYIIVLILVGRPMYYMETVIGQFSSKNSIQVYGLASIMAGVGWSQVVATSLILSYYVSILALSLYYLAMSFQAELPWSVCRPEWENCFDDNTNLTGSDQNLLSSSELYFQRVVLRQPDGIEGGIGMPLWDLTLCLLASWLTVFLVVARGVKSSGKASYFLALFPYVIMIVLFVRAVTLPGASDGILFFITPQWSSLYDINVWYAAVTQVFFSLSISSGSLIVFASYNKFRQNIYRDAMIVTTLDTFTSLLAGLTIFGILGNLAYELGYDDVQQVVGSGGTGLAFISYPQAISKFNVVPQLFSVLFFLMLFVLGVGTAVALLSCINTALLDHFPKIGVTWMSAITCTAGFVIGLVYVTPGGQYILELVDYYGGTFLRLFAGICGIVAVSFLYGLERMCLDIEFMLKRKTSVYWRWCWGIITPGIMGIVFVYALFNFEALLYGGFYVYPLGAYIAGYVMLFTGILQVPIWGIVRLVKLKKGRSLGEAWKLSLKPTESWGPRIPSNRRDWLQYAGEAHRERKELGVSRGKHIWYSLTGYYRNGQKL